MGENLTIKFLTIVIVVLLILMFVQIYTAIIVRRKTDVILETITAVSTKDRKVLHEKIDTIYDRLERLERK